VPLKKVELLRLGRRIRRERQLLGFSQKGFATKCGLDRSYLGGVERGDRNVTLSVLCAICDGLNCDIAAVTRGIPHPPTPPVATDANQSLEQRTRGGCSAAGIRSFVLKLRDPRLPDALLNQATNGSVEFTFLWNGGKFNCHAHCAAVRHTSVSPTCLPSRTCHRAVRRTGQLTILLAYSGNGYACSSGHHTPV